MSRWPLRRRVIAVLVGLVLAVALATGILSALALRDSLMSQLDQRLLASSQRALGAQHDLRGHRDAGGPPPGLDVPGQGTGTVSVSVGPDGTLSGYIGEDGTFLPLTTAQVERLLDVDPGAPATVDLGDLGSYRALAVTDVDDGRVVTGLSTEDVDDTVQDYVAAETGIALVAVAGAATAGGLLVRRQLRPLDEVAATATTVASLPLHEGQVALDERVPARYTDPATEVGQVGAALNRLLAHVEDALRQRHDSETQVRQFVADASHELRTPLASIRGYTELLRRLPGELPEGAEQAIGRVESESARMTTLVEDLLLLARLDAGRPLAREEVDLAVLAVDAVADAHVAGADHTWRLDLPDPEVSGPALVVGDEDRLRQVLANLLANARVHTPAGTTVTTSVRCEGDTVQLRVEDDGPGIAPELLPRLFHRFARGDAARSPGTGSTGLGLAIVDAVVRAHAGRVAADSVPGRTVFTVSFPAAPAD
ncbi:cell wall metabolism sensor histidine kinase WalK [Georgenia sp. 311]|uniref:sensor histidine kinase n=1 Tax=Georgenia sp. 311 TaxID=2585134 RepID=UPI00210018FE|nr:HAMP domain-containing sensor histidine kinase [Georgenia sp. 311]